MKVCKLQNFFLGRILFVDYTIYQYDYCGDYRDAHALIGRWLHQSRHYHLALGYGRVAQERSQIFANFFASQKKFCRIKPVSSDKISLIDTYVNHKPISRY